ncbi:hypothetical protein ACTID9_02375 [Brevibacillus fluminis]
MSCQEANQNLLPEKMKNGKKSANRSKDSAIKITENFLLSK